MGSRHRDWDLKCKVYIGNLSSHATKSELEAAFSKYGPLRNAWVARSPPGFGFVEFEDSRDAEDAVRHLDGVRLCGERIKVEMSTGKTRNGNVSRTGSYRSDRGRGGGGYRGDRDRYERGPERRYYERDRSRSPGSPGPVYRRGGSRGRYNSPSQSPPPQRGYGRRRSRSPGPGRR